MKFEKNCIKKGISKFMKGVVGSNHHLTALQSHCFEVYMLKFADLFILNLSDEKGFI